MTLTRLYSASLLILALTACGNLQTVPVAKVHPSVTGKQVQISDARPAKEEVAPRGYEVPGKSLFVQQTSGGSLAVGLMFGPLGVLANAANIDRITKELGESGASSGLYQIDAQAEAKAALAGAPAIATQAATGISIKPYVTYFVFDEKVGIDTIVTLRAESAVGAKDKWVGTYGYHLEDVLPVDSFKKSMSIQQLEEFRSKIRKAYVELFAELQRDISSAALPQREIAWVNARALGLGMAGDIERSESGRLVVRSNWGSSGLLYNTFIFPSAKQYSFREPPVKRETK